MGREFHVRFREGLGVQFPRATRLVVGFTDEADARRVLEVLPRRFGKYGLTLHPDKTRLVPFERPRRRRDRDGRPTERPGTFDFLGFTHYWGESREGANVVKQQTAASRLRRVIRTIADWCRRNSHRPLAEQHRELSQKLVGHYGYYGATGNADALVEVYNRVTGLWRRWLSRRSWAGRLSWGGFKRLLGRLALPRPRVVHSALLT
jgi:hypothetical protein